MNLPLQISTAHRDDAASADIPNPSLSHDDIVSARFAALVQAICPDAPPVDSACVQRMRAMLKDRDWQCSEGERAALQRLIAAADQPGAFDPALQDIAWPPLSLEGQAYADFLRVREREAGRRQLPVGTFAFDRQDWARARDAEAHLRDHQRHIRESSYAPADWVDMFRVH